MTEWANLTPAQRTQARLNFGEVRKVPADEKRAKWEEYQALPEEERARLASERPKPPAGAAPALRPVPAERLVRPSKPPVAGATPETRTGIPAPPQVNRHTLLPERHEPDAADVVVAERSGRHDPFWQRWQAQLFWALYRRYVVPEMPPGGVDIFACNRAFRDALLGLGESRSSLIAQIFWLGFRRASVPYERQPRRHGQSAWTWRKKLAYLADSVFAFTDLPVRLLTRVGALGLLVAAVLGVVVLFGKLSGLIGVPGYAMTLIAILFFGALNLLSLGIVGTYAWRAYENTKQRPQAIALRVDRFESR